MQKLQKYLKMPMFHGQHIRTVQNIHSQLHPFLKRTATATLGIPHHKETNLPVGQTPGPFLTIGQACHHSEIKPSSTSCIAAAPHTPLMTQIFLIFAPQIPLIS